MPLSDDILMHLMGRVVALEREFAKLRLEMRMGKRRRTSDLMTFLGQVATIRQWIIGGVLVALALKGTLSPTEWKSIFLSLIGAQSNG